MGGLLIAAAIGYGVGQVLQMSYKATKIDMPMQTIQDIQNQTSSEGGAQPIVYGIARPIGGNLIWQTKAEKKIWKEKVGRVKVKKSFPSGKNKYEDIYQEHEEIIRSYAIRICRGPNVEVLRVWKNDKLVYSVRDMDQGEWSQESNDKFLEKATFYSGAWDQMPDPHMEAKLGYGKVPAYRGLAYMVVAEDYLTDYRGAMPHYTFEVARPPGVMLTTKMYDPTWEDASALTAGEITGVSGSTPLDTWSELEPLVAQTSYTEAALSLAFRSMIKRFAPAPEQTSYNEAALDLTFKSSIKKLAAAEQLGSNTATLDLTFKNTLLTYETSEQLSSNVATLELTFVEK